MDEKRTKRDIVGASSEESELPRGRLLLRQQTLSEKGTHVNGEVLSFA
jgi:hypothetical protein